MAFPADERVVFVLGAGFTRAFVEGAPLLVDDYGIESLAERFAAFPAAAQLLDQERARYGDGRIDLERLWTRLDMLMPHDIESGAAPELRLLLSETRKSFLSRLSQARSGPVDGGPLHAFARFCVEHGADCITFNYDEFLDEHLWGLTGLDHYSGGATWHPDSGYGFYCIPAIRLLQDHDDRRLNPTPMRLFKLHGSTNWRVRRGADLPYAIGEMVHFEDWFDIRPLHPYPPTQMDIEAHLEPSPLLVPPVLSKTGLTEQPLLRMVWSQARESLMRAQRVVFVGYSFPVTDIAASFLFQEALFLLPQENIYVVNLAETDEAKAQVAAAYEGQLGVIPADNYFFDGANAWVANELP